MGRHGVAALAAAACALALLGRVEASPGLRHVWAVDDGEKVYQDDLGHALKGGGGNNTVWNGTTVQLFGGRNEIVAFQLILEANAEGAPGVNVAVSDLSGEGASIPGSHPLPGPNDYVGVGVELFTEHYLNVTQYSYGDPNWGGFYTTWEANPRLTGRMPDGLIPFSAAAGKGGAPFDIAPDMNQGVWVDVYVREGLPAGVYGGTIEVTVGGAAAAAIPVELEVMDFTLPDENHYRSMVFYSRENIATRHATGCCSAAMWEMILQYHRMAHRHRLELIGTGDWEEVDHLRGTITGDAFRASGGYEGPGEGLGNTLFSIHTYGWSFGSSEAEYRTNSDAWVNWFDANAPGVEYFLYLIDEPGPDRYDWIRQRAGWIHNNPGPGKRLPVFLTKWPMSDLIGAVDIWCMQSPWYDPQDVGPARSRGERAWVYAGNRPQAPMDVIDEYGVAMRLKPWIAYKCDVSRWFTWEATHWSPNTNEVPNDVPKNMFVDPVTFYAGYEGSRGNGDGTMFYPGEDDVFADQSREHPGPMSSIRMKMYRRGVQDYEYMWMAERLGYEGEVAVILANALPHVMWQAAGLPDWSNRNATYEGARRQLAALIEGRGRFPDVPPSHWSFWDVEACADAGLVGGYPDGLFRPGTAVSRDQMAVFVARAAAGGDGNVPEATGQMFPDVPPEHWAYRHIEYVAANDIVQGYGDGRYHPEYVVSRAQMAVCLARAIVTPPGEAGFAGYDPPADATFADVPTGFWCYKYVEYLAEHGIVGGYPDGYYRPTQRVTRDQMAAYMARSFHLGS